MYFSNISNSAVLNSGAAQRQRTTESAQDACVLSEQHLLLWLLAFSGDAMLGWMVWPTREFLLLASFVEEKQNIEAHLGSSFSLKHRGWTANDSMAFTFYLYWA